MLVRTLPLAIALASLALCACNREAGATGGPSKSTIPTTAAVVEQRAERAAVIAELDIDSLIVEESQALEHTRAVLAHIEDESSARRATVELVELRIEVAALGARRRTLAVEGAEPKSRLAYAMQREMLSKTEARIAQELNRLGAFDGVRDVIEDDLQPILDEFLGAPR